MSAGETVSTARPETILLVEDNVLVRIALSDYLRHCGYRVIEAATAHEALAVLQDGRISVQVVFADLQNTSAETFRIAQWVRQNRPAIDVVLAGTVQKAAHAAAEVCEDGPLEKPFHPETLLRRIQRIRAARDRR